MRNGCNAKRRTRSEARPDGDDIATARRVNRARRSFQLSCRLIAAMLIFSAVSSRMFLSSSMNRFARAKSLVAGFQRGAPQIGLARLIRRIQSGISVLILGRPRRRDRRRQ